MKVLITGATGLVGTALTTYLKSEGVTTVALDRDPAKWTKSTFEGADAVVNLAGKSIMGRWSESKKEELRSSRIDFTKKLVDFLSSLEQPPKVLVNASAIGYYGNRGEEVLADDSAKGSGFLSDVVQDWEKEALKATAKGIRVVMLRFGMILSEKGGALKTMLPAFKLGIGGRLGRGDQYVSWVAIDDVVAIIYEAIKRPELKEAVNVVAPNPVKNTVFTEVLAKNVNRPAIFPVPEFALKLIFGEMADELLLSSTRVES